MIANNGPRNGFDDLCEQFELALAARDHWTDVLNLFYRNPSFRKRLESAARREVRRFKLPPNSGEDISQEALVMIGESLRRDPSLGFDRNRGDFGAFISVIVLRCCQKSRRKLFRRQFLTLDEVPFEPASEHHQQIDEHLDLHETLKQIREPNRTAIQLLCRGLSIDEIANAMNCSSRTVYRRVDAGVDDIRHAYAFPKPQLRPQDFEDEFSNSRNSQKDDVTNSLFDGNR